MFEKSYVYQTLFRLAVKYNNASLDSFTEGDEEEGMGYIGMVHGIAQAIATLDGCDLKDVYDVIDINSRK